MNRRYPPEFHAFMRDYIPGHTTEEIRAEIKARFGIEMTRQAVRSYMGNHKIRNGMQKGRRKGHATTLFPREIKEYIESNASGVGPTEMAGRLNGVFGTGYSAQQIKNYYKNHHINSGLTGQFEQGAIPKNKGRKGECAPGCEKGWFRDGHRPTNKLPIGTIKKKSDGYCWRKTGNGAREWKQEHLIVWEEANGPIPQGKLVIFLDGDRENIALENLKAIDKRTNFYLNNKQLRTDNADITRAMITCAELFAEIKKERRMKNAMPVLRRAEAARRRRGKAGGQAGGGADRRGV